MKAYIVAGLILIAGIAVVWVVVWAMFFSAEEQTGPLTIPPGRYDTFMITYISLAKSDGFPDTQGASGPRPRPPKMMYEESRDLLDMKFTVGANAKDPTSARFAVQDALRRIEQIDEIASLKREDSELSKINREAFEHPVKLSDEMYFILKRSLEVSEKSKGAFDVTSSPIKWVWNDYANQGLTPPADKIGEARALVGYQSIQIDDKKRTIRFKKKGLTIDLADVIGGFAIDQAVYTMRNEAIKEGFASDGDGYRFIPREEGQYAILGIPDARGELKYTYFCDRPASVTKGYYSGYRFIGNAVVSNIVDPRSGTCVGGVSACTVVGPDAMTCDAMSTALCVLGGNQVLNFLAQFNPRETNPKPRPTEPGVQE